MSKRPPVPEIEFLKLSSNHGELTRKLVTLGVPAVDVLEYAKHVAECWFHLAKEHADEADKALLGGCVRAVHSRSYYAAYSASKAVRYLVRGAVSLKGDDHSAASTELPDDLPNVTIWSQKIVTLYEHRLKADYDNWPTTSTSQTLRPEDGLKIAHDFIAAVGTYLTNKFGMTL